MGTASRRRPQLAEPLLLAEVPATRSSGFGSLAWVRDPVQGDRLLFAFTGVDADGITHVEMKQAAGL